MKKWIVVALCLTGCELIGFWFYNHLIVSQQPLNYSMKKASLIKVKNKQVVTNPSKTDAIIKVSSAKDGHIAITDDQQFLAYSSQSNQLTITSLGNQNKSYIMNQSAPIVYLKWITDQKLFVGLKTTKGSSSDLILKTLDTASKVERIVHDFKGTGPSAVFKSITYSHFTNDVYTLIEDNKRTRMYRFDIMGYMHTVPLKKNPILNPMMLADGRSFFYEDLGHTIWQDSQSTTQSFQTQASLLSVYQNTLYYGLLDSHGKVTEIYAYSKGQRKKQLVLQNPAVPNHIVIRKDGSAVIYYGTHFYDTRNKKSVSLNGKNTDVIKNNTLFIVNQNGTAFVSGS